MRKGERPATSAAIGIVVLVPEQDKAISEATRLVDAGAVENSELRRSAASRGARTLM